MKFRTGIQFFLAGVLVKAPLAQADCLYECESSLCADFGNTTDLCLKTRADCQAKCGNKRSYGAIAYNTTDGAFGWSDSWDYQDQAQKTALKNCSDQSPQTDSGPGSATTSGCELIVWYYNSCGAVAADGKIVTWGRDSTKKKAEATAMEECAKADAKHCEIKVSQCSLK